MQNPPKFRRGASASSEAKFLLLALVVSLPLLLLFSSRASARRNAVNLTILHVNDTHGHIIPYLDKKIDPRRKVGGAAYMAQMIERERAANPHGTILLSAGDMFQGTPVSNLFHGKPVIEIMNYLQFDAMTLGNHEFDWGQGVLRSIISSATFPVVSANVFERGGGLFPGVKPFVILKRKGVRIGVIGLTTPGTYYTTRPENVAGLTFSSPEAVLPAIIRRVRAQGASIVIALTHLGLGADRRLAREVRGIDIIVGGHSHTAIMNPVVESGTVIVQAGSYGLYLGVLKITFDRQKQKIIRFTRKNELRLVSPSQGAFDPHVARIVDKYEAKVKGEFSKTIGTAAADLTRNPNGESGLGDLVADAIRSASGSQIAFQNNGGIRADIPKGPITLNELFTALPFDDNLVSMDLTGEQIRKILEQSAMRGNWLQISGMQIVYDMSRPAGKRVASAKVGGKPLEGHAAYRVVTNDFLAAGGDRFDIFKEGRRVTTGQSLRDAVADYIRRHSPMKVRVGGRIIFRN